LTFPTPIGHAPRLITGGIGETRKGATVGGQVRGASPPMDVALPDFDYPEMRDAIARRDITRVFKLLVEAGVMQLDIAALTDQRPGSVSEIVNGRPVRSYDLLVRIADGFGVPRGWPTTV